MTTGLFLVVYSRTIIEHPHSIRGFCRRPFFAGIIDGDDADDGARSPLLTPENSDAVAGGEGVDLEDSDAVYGNDSTTIGVVRLKDNEACGSSGCTKAW